MAIAALNHGVTNSPTANVTNAPAQFRGRNHRFMLGFT